MTNIKKCPIPSCTTWILASQAFCERHPIVADKTSEVIISESFARCWNCPLCKMTNFLAPKGAEVVECQFCSGEFEVALDQEPSKIVAQDHIESLVHEAEEEVTRLKVEGWTKQDFANALKKELKQCACDKPTCNACAGHCTREAESGASTLCADCFDDEMLSHIGA